MPIVEGPARGGRYKNEPAARAPAHARPARPREAAVNGERVRRHSCVYIVVYILSDIEDSQPQRPIARARAEIYEGEAEATVH